MLKSKNTEDLIWACVSQDASRWVPILRPALLHADTGLCLTEREGLPSFPFSCALPAPSSALWICVRRIPKDFSCGTFCFLR